MVALLRAQHHHHTRSDPHLAQSQRVVQTSFLFPVISESLTRWQMVSPKQTLLARNRPTINRTGQSNRQSNRQSNCQSTLQLNRHPTKIGQVTPPLRRNASLAQQTIMKTPMRQRECAPRRQTTKPHPKSPGITCETHSHQLESNLYRHLPNRARVARDAILHHQAQIQAIAAPTMLSPSAARTVTDQRVLSGRRTTNDGSCGVLGRLSRGGGVVDGWTHPRTEMFTVLALQLAPPPAPRAALQSNRHMTRNFELISNTRLLVGR